MSVAASLDDPPSRSIANHLTDELIKASGARPQDKIIIAGADQLELLTLFLRRGFTDVACLSAARGPHARKAQTDLLIAPFIQSEADLLHILHALGRSLRPGGMLVLRTPIALGNERQWRQVFQAFGFTAVERLPGRQHDGQAWCARKEAMALAHAA